MREERKWCVYCHTNKINGKKYIGITSNKPKYRWGKNGSAYIRRNQYFGNAIKKYGWNKFKHEIIKENISEKQAKQMEMELISKYNTIDKKFGYNLTSGGDGTVGYKFTEEQKRNHSEIKKETSRSGSNHPQAKKIIFNDVLYGHISEENLIKEINKYYNVKINTIKKYLNTKHIPLELYQLGLRYKDDDINDYTYFSKETISREISERMKNKIPWNKGTNFDVSVNKRKIIFEGKEYNSMTEFSKKNNICLSTISNILNGKTIVSDFYILGKLHYSDISFEEQLKLFKFNKNKSSLSKSIIYEDKIYDSISSFAKSIKEDNRKVSNWLYNRKSMPKEYIDKGLRYYDNEYESFIVELSNIPKPDSKKLVGVICENLRFKSITDCSKYYNLNSIGAISSYLSGSKPMPQKWKDRGLRYYNPETDKDLPYYKEGGNKDED